MLNRILRPFRKRASRHRHDARLDHLYSPENLQELLMRERARVDRRGGSLALITFTPHGGWTNQPALWRLAQTLRNRLRLTDFAGWLDDRRLAVVLPITDAKGAWRVADDLMLSLPDNQRKPVCRVYSYPTVWWSGDDGGHPVSEVGPRQQVHAAESLLVQPLPAWKRAIDMLGASVGLILLSPVMLAVAVAVRYRSPGPILFRQQRGGRGGRPFTMYKFRSMVVDAEVRKQSLMNLNEQDGPAFKITDDPRVTKVGHILRNTSLDELPQLWNVLKGEMSLVGPRPLPVSESEACTTWQKRRLDVTPGITCIWQCQGGKRVTFDEWMRMDIRYVKQRSLTYDLGLLFKTVFAVISRKVLKHG
jgi:lipopolysaccharide/colanic/teichoic acid biosynthesis glycosyltransferase